MSEEVKPVVEEPATKPSKAKKWASIVIGVILVVAGSIGVFSSEPVNRMFIEAGAEQSAQAVIEMYPDTTLAIGIASDTVLAAVEAREAHPDHLANLITEALKDAGVEGKLIKPIIEMVITQLNDAYKKSDTEEIYLQRAKAVGDGLRAAVPVKQEQECLNSLVAR